MLPGSAAHLVALRPKIGSGTVDTARPAEAAARAALRRRPARTAGRRPAIAAMPRVRVTTRDRRDRCSPWRWRRVIASPPGAPASCSSRVPVSPMWCDVTPYPAASMGRVGQAPRRLATLSDARCRATRRSATPRPRGRRVARAPAACLRASRAGRRGRQCGRSQAAARSGWRSSAIRASRPRAPRQQRAARLVAERQEQGEAWSRGPCSSRKAARAVRPALASRISLSCVWCLRLRSGGHGESGAESTPSQ